MKEKQEETRILILVTLTTTQIAMTTDLVKQGHGHFPIVHQLLLFPWA